MKKKYTVELRSPPFLSRLKIPMIINMIPFIFQNVAANARSHQTPRSYQPHVWISPRLSQLPHPPSNYSTLSPLLHQNTSLPPPIPHYSPEPTNPLPPQSHTALTRSLQTDRLILHNGCCEL